jgi:hypothetical protein
MDVLRDLPAWFIISMVLIGIFISICIKSAIEKWIEDINHGPADALAKKLRDEQSARNQEQFARDQQQYAQANGLVFNGELYS